MRELLHTGQLKGHQAVVVGAGRSGRAAAGLLHLLGARVRLLETNPETAGREVRDLAETRGWDLRVGPHTPSDFEDAQMVVLSPGVPRRAIAPFMPERPVQVLAELELASWFVSEPIIGVTGTNGKTTTTTLIGHILESCGRKTFLGGNLGIPLSEYVTGGGQAEILVLEASSFQLQNVSSFHPRVGVLLNFSANHLDFHADMDEYLDAKLKLFARQTPKDLAILPLKMKELLEGREEIKASRTYFIGSSRFACPALPGRHNQENMEAAYLACRYFGVSENDAAKAIATYVPLPHRMERIGEREGVLFIDDSKATTVDAMMAALDAVDRPVHLLAGGVFKGGDLTIGRDLLKNKVRSVSLFGGSRELFEAAWEGTVPLSWHQTIDEAVQNAASKALPGEAVLLSPATSSFDQFTSYKERGKAFRQAVEMLGSKRQ
ncbi:MAG: UDP-N-acetylmuramoyl-L-alanine--D-glutamate ligase [Desulfovibrionales bacterium]